MALVGLVAVCLPVCWRQIAYLLGQLLSNNNYRWYALCLAAILFTIEAIWAGFGEGLVIRAVRDLLALVDQWVKVETPAAPSNSEPSWVWWKMAGWTWLATLVYFFIAFREEMIEGFKIARYKLQSGTASGSASAGSVSPAVAGGSWSLGQEMKAEFAIEGVKEGIKLALNNALGRRIIL